jgi:hypothetical protein
LVGNAMTGNFSSRRLNCFDKTAPVSTGLLEERDRLPW